MDRWSRIRSCAIGELEECRRDHFIRGRINLLAAGKEHQDKSALGRTDVSWKKLEETARNVRGS